MSPGTYRTPQRPDGVDPKLWADLFVPGSGTSTTARRKLIGLVVVLGFFLALAALQGWAGTSADTVSDLALYGFLSFGAFAGANFGEHYAKAKAGRP